MATVEVLPGLPAEPPYAEQFAPVGISTFREGYVLRFEPRSSGPWCGNFQKAGGSYYCTHLTLATGEVVIIAGGTGYVLFVNAATTTTINGNVSDSGSNFQWAIYTGTGASSTTINGTVICTSTTTSS